MDDLPNLGEKSRQVLTKIGITTRCQLAQAGSVAVYAMAKHSRANVGLNLLWALEGALTGVHWQEVVFKNRTALLLALETYENSLRS